MSRVSLQTIADKLGYSKNTISLALRGDPQIPERTREKVKAMAVEMGYQPNAIVSQLMAQLRSRQAPQFQAKLALINAHAEKDAFERHPTIPNYVDGCEMRAKERGYSFDRFWLHDSQLRPQHLIRVLKTRNIKGILIVGLMSTNRLPAVFAPVWNEFPVAVTGVQTRDPTFSYCCVDHYDLVKKAFEKAISLGYKRPALVLDQVIDALVENRFSAGFLMGQQQIPFRRRIPPFVESESSKENQESFNQWYRRYQPDVVFTLYNAVIGRLEKLKLRIPEDIGVIQLEWRTSRPHIAGMDQHNTVTGAAAVDMLINQIHNNERGVPEFPLSTLIGSTWIDGKTVQVSGHR